jgi:hypothetical protein
MSSCFPPSLSSPPLLPSLPFFLLIKPCPGTYKTFFPFLFSLVLEFELRAYTFSHSLSTFL